MDTQKIEPLLMDHALGATTPEVGALIEAFQEKDTEVRARLEKWLEVAELARRAMEERAVTALPAFPRRQLQVARRGMQRRRMLAWSGGLAACVLIGYLLGNRGHDHPATPAAVTADPRPTSEAAVDVPVAGVKDLWSISRLRASAERNASRPVRSSATTLWNRWISFHQLGG